MSRADLDRLTGYVAGFGVLATVGAFALAGAHAGGSAAIGATMAIADFFLLKYIVGKVIDGNVRSQAIFSLMLFLKLFVFMGAIFAVIYSGLAAPIPFIAGISALMGGLLTGSFVYILTGRVAESEL